MTDDPRTWIVVRVHRDSLEALKETPAIAQVGLRYRIRGRHDGSWPPLQIKSLADLLSVTKNCSDLAYLGRDLSCQLSWVVSDASHNDHARLGLGGPPVLLHGIQQQVEHQEVRKVDHANALLEPVLGHQGLREAT